MPRLRRLTADDRQRMIEHLEHEVVMFFGALAEFTDNDLAGVLALDRDDPIRIRRTAFFEVVLLHARLLDEFLSQEPKRPDDFWAGDFVPGWHLTSPLAQVAPLTRGGPSVRDSINKQLAHLTLTQLQRQDFRLRDLTNAIIAGLRKFVEHRHIAGAPEFEQLHEWVYSTWSPIHPPIVSGS
jgi:hypothetical protein